MTYPFYLFFFLYAALKILAVATATPAFFALPKEKITSQNLGILFITNSLKKEVFKFEKRYANL